MLWQLLKQQRCIWGLKQQRCISCSSSMTIAGVPLYILISLTLGARQTTQPLSGMLSAAKVEIDNFYQITENKKFWMTMYHSHIYSFDFRVVFWVSRQNNSLVCWWQYNAVDRLCYLGSTSSSERLKWELFFSQNSYLNQSSQKRLYLVFLPPLIFFLQAEIGIK